MTLLFTVRYPQRMTDHPKPPARRAGTAAVPGSIDPLVDLLAAELTACKIAFPGTRPTSPAAFTRWYLEVVQLLESHVAGAAGRTPMTRGEVELMCRTALTARDLAQAMALCATFCAALYPRAGRLQIRRRGDEVAVCLDSLRREATGASSLCDITGLFAFSQLLQWLAGVDLRLREVRIGPVERVDVLPFLKLFGAPVLAGGSDYALLFPAAVLELPVVRSTAEFARFFEFYPCAVFGGGVIELPDQVAAVLGAAARRGGGLPTQAELARSLGLSLATFRRRLRGTGHSFRALREACLREEAANLLARGGGRSIADIASHLGFSDATAFRRSFRRWYGCAPSAWSPGGATSAGPARSRGS